MKLKTIIFTVLIVLGTVLIFTKLGSDQEVYLALSRGYAVIKVPAEYSTSNDKKPTSSISLSKGEIGPEKVILNIDSTGRIFKDVSDYKLNYIESADIYVRCSTDGPGGSSYCNKVLNSSVVQSGPIEVFKYMLQHVRETNGPKDIPILATSTVTTYDILLPSLDLVTIYPYWKNNMPEEDAEYIIRNIRIK